MTRLRRSDLNQPGIVRQRAGRGFVYLDPRGRRLAASSEEVERIKALVLPPAWTEVWISPWANGHIQAVGSDARGRRQYRYHDDWRLHRDREKFDRTLAFARRLPDVRAQIAADLDTSGWPKTRTLALALHLLDVGFFRIGSEEYATENGSFGLTTLNREHVSIRGDVVTFCYVAKSGKERRHAVTDPVVAEAVTALRRRRHGSCLLAYKDGRTWRDLHADDVNLRLREISGVAASAKDYRTWNATVLAAVALAVSWPSTRTRTAQTKAVRRAVVEVAEYLGNTPAVCRRSYIDPRVIDAYLDGDTIRRSLHELGADEDAVLATQGAVEAAVIALVERL